MFVLVERRVILLSWSPIDGDYIIEAVDRQLDRMCIGQEQ